MPVLSNLRHERFAQELESGGVYLAADVVIRDGKPLRHLRVFRAALKAVKDEAKRRDVSVLLWSIVRHDGLKVASIEAVCT